MTHNTVPVGYPVENTEVSLFNEAGEQVAIYGVGEIVVSKPTCCAWLLAPAGVNPDSSF